MPIFLDLHYAKVLNGKPWDTIYREFDSTDELDERLCNDDIEDEMEEEVKQLGGFPIRYEVWDADDNDDAELIDKWDVGNNIMANCKSIW